MPPGWLQICSAICIWARNRQTFAFSLYLYRFFCFGTENGADPTIETDSGYNSMDLAVALGYRSGEYFRSLGFHLRKALYIVKASDPKLFHCFLHKTLYYLNSRHMLSWSAKWTDSYKVKKWIHLLDFFINSNGHWRKSGQYLQDFQKCFHKNYVLWSSYFKKKKDKTSV